MRHYIIVALEGRDQCASALLWSRVRKLGFQHASARLVQKEAGRWLGTIQPRSGKGPYIKSDIRTEKSYRSKQSNSLQQKIQKLSINN